LKTLKCPPAGLQLVQRGPLLLRLVAQQVHVVVQVWVLKFEKESSISLFM
jgi:hypothetical protein